MLFGTPFAQSHSMRPAFDAAVCLVVLALSFGACVEPLGSFGSETVTTELEQRSKDARLEDDRIEDKHPVQRAESVVTETFGTCEVKLNKSGSVTKLDIVPFSGPDAVLDGVLFSDRRAALEAIEAAGGTDLVPSMEVVNGKLKPFNDGLYAAAELAAQNGATGKRALLLALTAKLVDALPTASPAVRRSLAEAATFLGAALELGGTSPALPSELLSRAQQTAAAFRTNTLYARPLGFYNWTPELQGIFTQDRFLQSGDDDFGITFGGAAALAVVLEAHPALGEQYQRVLTMAAHLTNPFISYPLTALFPYVDGLDSLADTASIEARFRSEHPMLSLCGGPLITVFPASTSKDSRLYASLFCETAPPTSVALIDILITAIRDGAVDLSPDASSGWYDYQLHALETLLIPERGPESDHLLLTKAYKEKLVETFKSIITQTRETHVKQLAIPGLALAAAPRREVEVYPKLPVEPFPTFYLRSARGYRFLSTFLQAAAPDLLASGHRLQEDGATSPVALGEELHATAELLYGLHLLAAEAIGVSSEASLLAEELTEFPLEVCRARATAWLSGWREDADVLRDPRVMVPVASTPTHAIYWATIGVKVYTSSAAYVPGFEPVEVQGGTCEVKGYVPRSYLWLLEEMVEVRLRRDATPPTRTELRTLCDAKKTREAIVAALEAL